MKIALIVVIVFVVATFGQNIKVISKLVQDLIKTESINILTVVSCWPQTDKFHFVKTLNIPIQMAGPSKMPTRVIDESTNKQWYFMDMRCIESHEFLLNIESAFFGHPYRWILLEPIADKLNKSTFLTDSNVLLINFNSNLSRAELKQAYKIDKELPFIYENVGFWNLENGFTDLRATQILSRRRRNLSGKVLKSTLIPMRNETIGHFDDIKNAHIDPLAKMGFTIINILGEYLNSTVEHNFVDTWGYGDLKYPEKLKGMVGHLVRREIDISGNHLYMTPERLPYIEYLSVTLLSRGAFVFRAPPLSHVSNIYYLPFSGFLWICAMILVVIGTTVIFITFKFSKGANPKIFSSDFLLYAISTVCQMGSFLIPKRTSARIATFTFYLGLIFLYTSYTANIVALLQSTSTSIKTLSDLLNSNIELGVEDSPYLHFFFSTETEPIRKKIYDTKIAPPNKPHNWVNVSYGVSRMREGMYAIHMELGTGYKHVKNTFSEREKCGLTEIEYLRVFDPWQVIPKYSPFKEIFKVALFRIREHGIQEVEKARRYTSRPICSSQGQNFESVGIIECHAAFFVLCYGMAAAIGILCFEYFWKAEILLLRKQR